MWFIYILSATFIYGIMNFIYKVAAVHNCSSHKIVNRSALTVSILSLIFIIITGSKFKNIKLILFFAIINSLFFAIASILKITALKKAPSSIIFPITKLNSVFVVIISILWLKEKLLLNQWFGIIISFIVLIFISLDVKTDKTLENNRKQYFLGIIFALIAAMSTSISMITGKFASTSVEKLNYIFVSYSFVMIFTFFINKIFYKNKKDENTNKIYLFGIIIGILNFSGYFLILKAFSQGKLSLIQGIFSNSFLIPIILSVIIFKEKLNKKKAIVILATIISIILIKLK